VLEGAPAADDGGFGLRWPWVIAAGVLLLFLLRRRKKDDDAVTAGAKG